MPTTINELIEKFKLPKSEVVKWGKPIPTKKEGIYIVSLSEDPEKNGGIRDDIPISPDIIDKWIKKRKGFKLDGVCTCDKDLIIERLSQFWFPDENILYIGKAPKGIRNRVEAFYKTEYGERSPHAGGHWIKSLSNLNDLLYVHYVLCDNSGEIEIDKIEIELLEFFIKNVSGKSKSRLRDREKKWMLPFGNLELRNLELKKRHIKNHGLGNMKKKKERH